MSDPRHGPHSDLAALTLIVLGAVLLLMFLAGCATTIRLNEGECLVIVESEQIVTAGKDCSVKRFNR